MRRKCTFWCGTHQNQLKKPEKASFFFFCANTLTFLLQYKSNREWKFNVSSNFYFLIVYLLQLFKTSLFLYIFLYIFKSINSVKILIQTHIMVIPHSSSDLVHQINSQKEKMGLKYIMICLTL